LTDRNKKRLTIVGTIVGLVIAAIAILTWFGVPSMGDLVTEVRAGEMDTAIKVDLEAQIVAVESETQHARELNATEHRQFQKNFDRQQKSTEEIQKEVRWMFKRILTEVGE